MSHQPWPVSPFPRHNMGASSGVESEPVCVPEDHLKAAVSLSFEELVGKVWSKELGFNDFIVPLTEEACRSTGATGAAVALRSDNDDAVICRARIGETAPTLGSRLNTESGISGECMRTGKLLLCDDTEFDPRVDPQVCRALRVRSIVAVPLWGQNRVSGILEVFSNSPRSFRDSDIEQLKKLACFATAAMRCPADNSIVLPASVPCSETGGAMPSMIPATRLEHQSFQEQSLRGSETSQPKNFVKSPYWVIGGGVAAIVLVLLSLGVLYWEHRSKVHEPASPQRAEVQTAKTQPLNPTELTTADTREDNRAPDTGETSDRSSRNPPNRKHSRSVKVNSRIDQRNDATIRDFNVPKAAVSQPGGDIQNYAPPSADALPAPKESTFISSVLSIPASLPAPPLRFQGITPGRLEHKVEPIYPRQARMARVDGAVTLRATVGTDGKVQQVRVISGNPLLVHAAVDAVSQWRYKPYQLNNHPVAVQTDIVIVFRLP